MPSPGRKLAIEKRSHMQTPLASSPVPQVILVASGAVGLGCLKLNVRQLSIISYELCPESASNLVFQLVAKFGMQLP